MSMLVCRPEEGALIYIYIYIYHDTDIHTYIYITMYIELPAS